MARDDEGQAQPLRKEAGDAPAPRPAAGSGECENLSGGEGRGVFFRPDRYGMDDLGLIHPVIRLTLGDGDVVECRLHDVSQNGVGFYWDREGEPPPIDTVLPWLCVTFDDYVAYEGTVRVSSLRGEAPRRLLGAAFLDTLMDVEDVLRLRDVRAWEKQISPRMTPAGKAWHVEGHHAFKACVSEFRLFLEDAKAELDALEKEVPPHVLNGEGESAARTGLRRLVRSQFVEPFVSYTEHIDSVLREEPGDVMNTLREFSHRQVQHLLLESPFFRRCLYKPLGYPGDYVVLSHIYTKRFSGPRLFGRSLDYGQVSLTSGVAVRNRKDLLRDMLLERVRAPRASDAPIRLVSIASGPAQEFVELVERLEEPPRPVEFVLFDQDKEALAYAYGRLRGLVDRRFPDRIRVRFLHDSIRRLLHDPAVVHSMGPYDAIVCAGLFDYLPRKTAIALAARLHGELREGGAAWLGNMRPCNPSRWIMGMHGDWNLIYRTAEELLDLGRSATGGTEFEQVEEPTGVNPFLVLRR